MNTVESIFGVKNVDGLSNRGVPIREPVNGLPENAYPKLIDPYTFQAGLLGKLLRIFIGKPTNPDTLLIGDTGCGKSSIIEQVATRLGWPVFSIACSGRLRVSSLFGCYVLKGGETLYQYGPLSLAMIHGGVFLANEITRLASDEQMALAEVLDSGRVTIPETGEVLVAHPSFRFFATGNSGGFGDESGAYAGERVSSFAFLDRFQKLMVHYLSPEQETALLKKLAKGKLPTDLIDSMVALATDMRKHFVSRGGSLRLTMSTRALTTWALETVSYKTSGLFSDPAGEALEDTVLNGAPQQDVEVVQELWRKWINEPGSVPNA